MANVTILRRSSSYFANAPRIYFMEDGMCAVYSHFAVLKIEDQSKQTFNQPSTSASVGERLPLYGLFRIMK